MKNHQKTAFAANVWGALSQIREDNLGYVAAGLASSGASLVLWSLGSPEFTGVRDFSVQEAAKNNRKIYEVAWVFPPKMLSFMIKIEFFRMTVIPASSHMTYWHVTIKSWGC